MSAKVSKATSLSILAPQTLETTLGPKALQDLRDLKTSNNTTNNKLREHLANATRLLGETATQINDRGTSERHRHANKKRRLAADAIEEPEDDRVEYEAMQDRVTSLTNKFDLGIRQAIDDRVWVENLPDALNHVVNKSNTASSRTVNPVQPSTNSDGKVEGARHQDNGVVSRPEASENPTALLHAAISTHNTSWKSKTLTERYAQDNDYTGYYRAVYDAKHPEENAPPMPHFSLWFASQEGRSSKVLPRSSQRPRRSNSDADQEPPSTQNMIDLQSSSEDEDEIEIQSEKIRLTCPITLQPFIDPVRSMRCPHAYEKSAILDILRTSSETVPLTAAQNEELASLPNQRDRVRREKEMKTPMIRCPECSVPLTAQDLQPDPVLLRKVNRMLEKQRKEEEADRHGRGGDNDVADLEDDDDDDDDVPRGTQRRNVVNIGSSPAAGKRSAKKVVKGERRMESVVPQTQLDADQNEDEDEDMDV